MPDIVLHAMGVDLPLLTATFLASDDPELRLAGVENAAFFIGARIVSRHIGSPIALRDPILEDALRPTVAYLGRLAPDRFPPGLSWPRPLFLMAGEGARWLVNETHGLRATPTALLRLREILGKLETVLASAATSRRLPDFEIPLSRLNRAMAEVAPAFSITLSCEKPTTADWKQP